jgi:hypothetical protein
MDRYHIDQPIQLGSPDPAPLKIPFVELVESMALIPSRHIISVAALSVFSSQDALFIIEYKPDIGP